MEKEKRRSTSDLVPMATCAQRRRDPEPHVRAAVRRARGSRDRQRQRHADRPAGASATSAPISRSKTIGQGFDMGRPSILEASAERRTEVGLRDARRPISAAAACRCMSGALRSQLSLAQRRQRVGELGDAIGVGDGAQVGFEQAERLAEIAAVGDQPLDVGQLPFEVDGDAELVGPRLGDLARGDGQRGAIGRQSSRRGLRRRTASRSAQLGDLALLQQRDRVGLPALDPPDAGQRPRRA